MPWQITMCEGSIILKDYSGDSKFSKTSEVGSVTAHNVDVDVWGLLPLARAERRSAHCRHTDVAPCISAAATMGESV